MLQLQQHCVYIYCLKSAADSFISVTHILAKYQQLIILFRSEEDVSKIQSQVANNVTEVEQVRQNDLS